MINDISQVSPTLRTDASGWSTSLGSLCKSAGQDARKRKPLRQFKVGKDLGRVVLSLIDEELRPAVREPMELVVENEFHQQASAPGSTRHDDLVHSEVCQSAFTIRCGINAARTALTAYSARGQLASWRMALPFLPSSYQDAAAYLDVFSDKLADSLRAEVAAVAPVIAHLNSEQPSAKCWSRPVGLDKDGKPKKRGCWTGRSPWFTHADEELAKQLCGPGRSTSPRNRQAILWSILAFVDQNGRNLTASHQTIAKLAIAEYGCTLSEETAKQRVRTIRRILNDAGFIIVLEEGGHMTSIERLAAEVHHGGQQTRCGNTCDLNLPRHLRPATPPAPEGPAYAEGLDERLAERDRQYCQKSPYAGGSGFQSLIGNTGVSLTRACAREQPAKSTLTPPNTPPSLRDWRIAEDLTRRGTRTAAENGPYAHLIGPAPSQMALAQLARVVAALVPEDVDTKLLLRGLAHAATSPTTGFIALGLRTKPRNAYAWITTVLRSIDWAQRENFPSWSITARAFGVHWCGDRHKWRIGAVPEASQPKPASTSVREKALAKIRKVLAKSFDQPTSARGQH